MPGSRSPTPISTSRKSSTGKRSPTSETSYEFLNFSHPSEAKDKKARRTVRSHVTRQQHQKEQLAAAVRRSNSMPQPVEVDQQPKPNGRAHAASFPLMPRPNHGSVVGLRSPASTGSSSPQDSVVSSPLSLVTSLDPGQLYPSHWLPYINVVLDHYVASMVNNILGPRDESTSEAFRVLWIPFVFTDVALLHATVLLGASFLESPPGPRPHTIDVLQLKGMTIGALNDSLQDPARSISDQVIAAVLAMAQYEAFWGEAQAFAFHMQALQNMIQMRGGFTGISASMYGLLERIVLFVDFHASRATETQISFDPARFPSRLVHPALTARRALKTTPGAPRR